METIDVEDLYPDNNPDRILLGYLKSIYLSVHQLKYNFLAVSTGKHRVGKSVSATLLCSILDKTFYPNLEERVVYYPEQFMDAMKDIANKNIIGGAIVWDEAGVGIPARSWYELSNKSINFVTQVMGYLRPIIFFVTQDMTYIDSQPRKLFHAFYECYRNSTQYNFMKPFEIQYDKRKGKIYYKYPRISRMVEDIVGSTIKLNKIKVDKPPKEMIDRYEQHSFDFKDRIMLQMEERIRKYDQEETISKKNMTQKEILEKVIGEHKRYESKRSKLGDPILDYNLIRFDFSIPTPLAKFIKADAERVIKQKQMADFDDS